ncbi:IS3 family transposase [Clostridium perfringens]
MRGDIKEVDKYTTSFIYKYIAIKELHELGYSISDLCKCAKIARTSYYKWLNRSETERDKENKVILDEIIKLYSEVKGIYGYRRITLNINRMLTSNYNHKRIYRLMKSVKLAAVIRQKKKRYIQSSPQIIAENILNVYFIIIHKVLLLHVIFNLLVNLYFILCNFC